MKHFNKKDCSSNTERERERERERENSDGIVIQPKTIPFISYPYEWSFGQLRDAALLTLTLQRRLLEKNFSLKDASAYNVQFIGYKPIFIDTLSFEPYREEPWVAFGQFCRHFLYPLMLMSASDLRFNNFLKLWIDGIPPDIVDKLLPCSKYFSIKWWLYIKLQNTAQKKRQNDTQKASVHLRKPQLLRLIDGLTHTVRHLKPNNAKTAWGDYYTFTNYSDESFAEKTAIVKRLLQNLHPQSVWDLGANNGHFSRLASEQGISTIAWDIDPIAVEKNYQLAKQRKEEHLLPLLLDLTNPSSGIGWANEERSPISQRGKADCCMALALVHHLAIGNNVPFENIAAYFSTLCRHLIVEFIPKNDSKVQQLLLNRKDVFDNYTQENFLSSFSEFFTIEETFPIKESLRTLYLMKVLP